MDWQRLGMDPFFKEMAFGLLGLWTALFLGFIFSWGRKLYLRRKYPVRGEYITFFHDTVDANTITQTAISQLKQSGRDVTGTTKLRSGRVWRLDAAIMGVGHIAGVYSAEATDDEGVGSFYLRIEGLTLDGIWSGYDHINKKITSGRYIFKRKLKVRVRKLRQSEAAAALGIAEKVFGPNYLSDTDLNGTSGLTVFAAISDHKLVGFAAIEKAGGVSAKLAAGTKLPQDVKLAEKTASLGIIKTVAVREDMQQHGLGEQLFLAAERILRREGKSLIAVPAWQDDKGVHLYGILAGNGYEPFLTCAHYWKTDCDSGVFVCKCRQSRNECLCNLIWYKKAVVPFRLPIWRQVLLFVQRLKPKRSAAQKTP